MTDTDTPDVTAQRAHESRIALTELLGLPEDARWHTVVDEVAGVVHKRETGHNLADVMQFTIRTTVNGAQIGDVRELADPFVRETVTISAEDLADAASSDEGTLEVVVHVDGTRAALAHVFRPIDLSPNDEHPAPSGAVAEGAED